MAYNMASSIGAGRRVYNGGSNSANRGKTLDPSGYINRSQRMQTAAQRYTEGRPSSNRSGLAAGAMDKMQQFAQQRTGGSPGVQTPPVARPLTERNPDIGGLAPLNFDAQQAAASRANQLPDYAAAPETPAGQYAQGSPFVNQVRSFDTSGPEFAAALAAAKIQGVPSSITGKLISDLDRDLRYNQQSGYNELIDLVGGLQSQQGEIGAEYQTGLRDLETESDQGFRELAARFAAMGGGPGTGYGTQYQDLAKELTNFRNDLDSWFTRNQQDFTRERTSGIRDFETLLSHLKGTQADRDAKEAAEKRLKEKREAEARKKAEAAKKKAAKKSKPMRSSRSGGSSYRSSSSSSYRSSGSSRSSSPKRSYAAPKRVNKNPTRKGAIKGKKGSRKQYRGGGHYFE